MRNTSLIITVPHLSSPISAFSAESKTYISSSASKLTKHLKIFQSNLLDLKYFNQETNIFLIYIRRSERWM